MNYRITVCYDGTRYKGWQSQKSTDATIQGKLEAILAKETGMQVDVIGSGRTDAGVHAKGQVANFHLKENYAPEELTELFNRYLPEDIAVLETVRVPERFHSRFFAEEKVYCYRIHTGSIPDVFRRRYQYDYPDALDTDAMRRAAGYLTGTHDFTSFCGNRHFKKSAVRSIYEIRISREADILSIWYRGNGFLQNMVRILTGTLIEVGRGERRPESMEELLLAKDRSLAGYTAPPQGLMLMQVNYKKESLRP